MLQTNFLKLNKQVNQNVQIGGFVNSIRDHGGLIFIDLRSQSDLVQCVINPENNQEIFDLAQSIGSEFVLRIEGQVVERDEKLKNPKIPTGSIEIIVEKLEIIASAKTLPFEIDGQNVAGEEIRLKYRYLDLRRNKLKEMLTLRHKLILKTRNWFDKEGFIEVQTPILANSTPEGSRDYLVPSRLHPGKFYALPQAPQQFKQLLMVGGFTKYFQIAPCFRDEDPRADRAVGDFYQLDLEMAWAKQEDIFEMFEKYVSEVLVDTQLTQKTLADKEFTKLTYQNAMDWFGSDKPDLRIVQNKVENKRVKSDETEKIGEIKLKKSEIENELQNANLAEKSEIEKLQDILQKLS